MVHKPFVAYIGEIKIATNQVTYFPGSTDMLLLLIDLVKRMAQTVNRQTYAIIGL